MKLLYEGKAKQLFDTGNPEEVYVHYKNSATAFNGVKKEEFDDKGRLKQVNETDQVCRHVTIIPLEVITRNIVAGSMAKKYGLEEGRQLAKPVFELSYKNDELGDPLINDDHAVALELVTEAELAQIKDLTARINRALQDLFLAANLILVDFKIEFGKTSDGQIILADEISPDTCRLWDKDTRDKLDKDRFRRDLGDVMAAYKEVLGRLENARN